MTTPLTTAVTIETGPCSDCGTTSEERSACPLCGKVYCQPCAETPYAFCCDVEEQPE